MAEKSDSDDGTDESTHNPESEINDTVNDGFLEKLDEKLDEKLEEDTMSQPIEEGGTEDVDTENAEGSEDKDDNSDD